MVSLNRQSEREYLTAGRNYYVATTGSDSNDGLTVGNPFLTIQKAIDVVSGLDLGTFNAIINLANGTYQISSAIVCKETPGNGTVLITGDAVTPSNVVIELTGADYAAFTLNNLRIPYRITGIRFDINNATSGTQNSGAIDCRKSSVQLLDLEVTASDGQNKPINWFRCEDNGNMTFLSDVTIDAYTGTAPSEYTPFTAIGSATIRLQNRTVTVTNTPDWTNGEFVNCLRGGVIFLTGNSYVGSATGVRFRVADVAFINEGAAGVGLPGDTVGVEDTATSGHIT